MLILSQVTLSRSITTFEILCALKFEILSQFFLNDTSERLKENRVLNLYLTLTPK